MSEVVEGYKTDSAAALAVFNATSSVPPLIKIDFAATIAVSVAREIKAASTAAAEEEFIVEDNPLALPLVLLVLSFVWKSVHALSFLAFVL